MNAKGAKRPKYAGSESRGRMMEFGEKTMGTGDIYLSLRFSGDDEEGIEDLLHRNISTVPSGLLSRSNDEGGQ